MAMVKSTSAKDSKAESGIDAAVDRLTKAALPPPALTMDIKQEYKAPRNYASDDARGKTRCVTWNAAVMSPSLAGMKWKTPEDFLRHVKRIADAGVNYSFDEKIEGL